MLIPTPFTCSVDASYIAQHGVPARAWKLAQALPTSGLRDKAKRELDRDSFGIAAGGLCERKNERPQPVIINATAGYRGLL